MAGRRRQPADRSRHICEDGDGAEKKVPKERAGEHDRETPKKTSKKLSRTTRTGAARSSLSAPSVPPGSEREEEPCQSKKTPKQFSRYQPWTLTLNSPSNDGDQQQEIFWDPHSPTTFKLENGKKRLAANKYTVDISDIVNRIAPKNEKPSSSDAAYLGFWIGENAIPCTPVVTRTRTKMPRSRILQTEEELMKLARLLDNNLVKQKDQSEEQAANSDDEMFSGGNTGNNEDDSFLEDIPEGDDIAHVLKSVSQTSAPQRISQKSVDQEAEAAFNALFDSSTQKYSGHLSQGLSDVSTSSLNDAPVNVRSNVNEVTGYNRREPCPESLKKSEQSSLASKFPTSTFQGVRKCSEQNNDREKKPVQSVSNNQDDFEDDWGNDLLEDDSFIMQVTQNPELITTPKNSMASNKTNALLTGGEVKSLAISSTSSKTNNFKFVPKKVTSASEVKTNNLCSTGGTSINIFQGNSRDTNNAKTFASTQTLVPSKPQTNVGGQNTKNNVHNLVPAIQSTLTKASQKPSAQTAPQSRGTTVTKDSILHDEWNDPKFSDEVLDMFCESDSLWEEKEDDDDLLYQVCDDVEKLTQAQEVNDVNLKKETSQLPSSTCQMFAKSGNTSRQNNYASHVAASSFLGSNKLNIRGVSPASFSGNCSNTYQNSSLQKFNQTFSRSNSVPSGMECKNIIPASTHTQNPVKSLDASCSAKDTLAPSKYSFTRVKPSQVTTVHVAQSVTGNQSAYNGLNSQSFGDGRNGRDTIVQYNSGNIGKPQQSLIKRHLSESTIQSSKVFVSEDKSKKCSMEEIERKKQEALARRKMKVRASSSDTVPS
ncbi:ewing's tumor-associated antigen 1 [Hyla sarda]|uniref:ewing's tumor-associated antigen 1 n=1 Tax=Hyla sarda TaxID=327740 RepID=UPI0024C452BF|nr:ewing's tumor-associated antigen 1 [Hyla sarda]